MLRDAVACYADAPRDARLFFVTFTLLLRCHAAIYVATMSFHDYAATY